MKIASWNVNSLKVRLPQLLDWLAAQQPDVVCLQESKLDDPLFPKLEIEAAGYRVAFSGQKTYNGVALLTREPANDIVFGNPFYPDPQKRLLAATVRGIRIVCAYVPNGQAVGSDKYAYKLAWLDALSAWIGTQLADNPRLILAGDFNDWRKSIHNLLVRELHLQDAHQNLNQRVARTFPSFRPILPMDRIYLRGFQVRTCEIMCNTEWRRISDHCALLAGLSLRY